MSENYRVLYNLSMVEDFTYSFVYVAKVFEKIFPDITYSKKVREMHKKLQNELCKSGDAFYLFANEDMHLSLITNIKDCYFTGEERVKFSSINEVIEKCLDVPEDELVARVLLSMDNKKNAPEFYSDLVNEPVKATKYIGGMQISDQHKTLLLSMFIDKAGYKQKMLDIATKAKEITEKIYESYAAYIKSSFKIFSDEQKVRTNLEQGEMVSAGADLTIVPVIFNSSLIRTQYNESGTFVYLGFEFVQYFENYKNRELQLDLESVGRLFSDKSRCQVVEILRENESYLQELSRMLNVPNNTLHYHVQLLSDAGVVLGRNEGRKCIYRLNDKYFEALRRLSDKFLGFNNICNLNLIAK